MIHDLRTMPPELENKLNELRQDLRNHGFAFGCMFVADVHDDACVLWFALCMPHAEKIKMLRELKYCVRETLELYENVV